MAKVKQSTAPGPGVYLTKPTTYNCTPRTRSLTPLPCRLCIVDDNEMYELWRFNEGRTLVLWVVVEAARLHGDERQNKQFNWDHTPYQYTKGNNTHLPVFTKLCEEIYNSKHNLWDFGTDRGHIQDYYMLPVCKIVATFRNTLCDLWWSQPRLKDTCVNQ